MLVMLECSISYILTPEHYIEHVVRTSNSIMFVCVTNTYGKVCVLELFCWFYLCDYWHMNRYSCIQCSE